MGIFDRLFGKKQEPSRPAPPPRPAAATRPPPSPADEGEPIRVADGYGREMRITRRDWRTSVLPGTLRSHWDQPDALYGIILQALEDGFAAEVVDAAAHLHQVDPLPDRGACIYGIALMQNGRLDEAERVLQGYLQAHGDSGVVLTNLAKVYAGRNDDRKAEETLWRGLLADPNQDNGVEWYVAMHRDRFGDTGGDALRRIAALPGSWRAQLWLARAALAEGDRQAALALYHESLSRAGDPVPADALMQISGDLGNHGMLAELLELAGPRFVPGEHGLMVGNNLVKAYLDTGQVEPARRILGQLYALNRPDWRETLDYWDHQLAQAGLAPFNQAPGQPLSVGLLAFEAPVWTGSEAARTLYPPKRDDAPRICFLGSSAEKAHRVETAEAQLTDVPGRLSRALPLFLAEQVALTTQATAHTLVPWVNGAAGGFVLVGESWSDDDASAWAAAGTPPADYVVITHITALGEPWTVELRLLRARDAIPLGTLGISLSSSDPGPAVRDLAPRLLALLAEDAEAEPRPPSPLYQLPEGSTLSSYLVRLEQVLAIRTAHGELNGRLNGEREIIEGNLLLCLDNPRNPTTRLLLAETLRAMHAVNPAVVQEFAKKVRLLQTEHPLPTEANALVETSLRDVYPV